VADEVLHLQLEGRRYILYPERQVPEVVLEVIKWWEHLIGNDLVVDVGQHVKYLATL
jgi:hypothetical protein